MYIHQALRKYTIIYDIIRTVYDSAVQKQILYTIIYDGIRFIFDRLFPTAHQLVLKSILFRVPMNHDLKMNGF